MEYILLIITGFAAGWINTIAGGGSTFMLPILIFMGLPADVANGTNRVTIFIQNICGYAGYKSRGYSGGKTAIYYGIAAMIGAVIGARVAIDIPDKVFHRILAAIILLVLLFLIFQPRYEDLLEKPKTRLKTFFGIVIFFVVGLYGGFIQVGTGFVILMIISRLHSFSLIKSNAAKTAIIMIYSLAALATFTYYGNVHWTYGLTLASGAAAGAWFGSRWAVKKGDKVVRIFLVMILIFMAVKLWWYDAA